GRDKGQGAGDFTGSVGGTGGKGETALVAFLKEQTGKSLAALQKAVATQASQSSGTGETPQDNKHGSGY
ncbi:hypothetical protein, partial [Scytonema sp. PRP1]|uniref:hypothetical protein n=1 Tax=Scytonema sp. PRP1 TaxID=3120513 RepID=UPI00300C0100